MEAILAIAHQYETLLIALILTIPRIYAFMSSSQLFSSTTLPGLTRVGAILTLVLLASPINLSQAHQFDRTIGSYIILFAKEYAIGAVLGYLVAWIFWVVQTAGSFIDNQRGASIASSIDPLMGVESSPVGDMFSLVFLTYLFATGSILQILGLLFNSFRIWPVSETWPALPFDFPRLILEVFDYSMRLGFNIAAPIIAVMFLAEFSLAMISRFAPQVQVFVLAMPIKSLLAIFMLVFYSTVLFPYVDSQVGSSMKFSGQFYEIMKLGERVNPGLSSPKNGGARP